MTDIHSLIAQMTLEEKAALCTGSTTWSTTPVERLGIPELYVTDGPHGVRRQPDAHSLGEQSLPATCFPTASSLASSWDIDLVEQVGRALGEECIALNVDVLLGPGANMKRSPLCGRNFEYFSEDPYLAGEMAVRHIQGVQSQGVGTSLKHYAANNQEFQRFTISAEVDERALREIYLPAFEKAVKQGKPWTVMCAYNKVNGTYASEHKNLLTDILKNEWGFDGFVVSDWGAVRDRVKSLLGGLDLEMPGPKPGRVQAVVDAVRSGALDEALLDESVRRILTIVMRAAAVKKGGKFDVEAHHAFARKAAAEGMVLLKNNGILPLHNVARIAVIGRSGQTPHFQGGGSSHINPTRVDNPMEELKKLAGGAEIRFSEGYPADDSQRPDLIEEAVESARWAEVALLYIALPTYKESEGYDRADLDLTTQQVALIKAVTAVQPNTVVVLNNGSAVTMSEWIDGTAAVLEAWMMGQAGGGAIADILFGLVNPSGKLSETFPLRLEDTPAYLNFPGENGKVRYGEGIYIGYRWYEAKALPVLFPFGYGLSYTTFAYSNARLSAAQIDDTQSLTVTVDVTNTGKLAGKEVVQVYVRDLHASLPRPVKELKGFAKVELQPGETCCVSFVLSSLVFQFYHNGYAKSIVEEGDFEILIGASSADIRAVLPLRLTVSQKLSSLLHRESTPREWLDDTRGRIVFGPMFQHMQEQFRQSFSGDDSGGIGMDAMGFLMDTPLLSLLHFQADSMPVAPEVIVDDLLIKVKAME